jgi:uncharacterized protein YdbL (DUF1318 family)
MRALGFVAVTLLAGLLAIGGLATACSAKTARDRGAVQGDVKEGDIIVPDLVALGGESDFSKELSEWGKVVRYGDARRQEAYTELARKAGLTLDAVVMSEDDEVFAHGSAGWPRGQDPGPGASVPRGSTVRLVLISQSDE